MSKDALKLEKVFLSNGVGCFVHSCQVEGETTLKFSVRKDQVDDVLKSAVIFDRGGIGHVRLQGEDPLHSTFREMPFGVGALDNTPALLQALKGNPVTVTTSMGRSVSGRILSVCSEDHALNEKVAGKRTALTLETISGLQRVIIEQASEIRFDEPLQGKIKEALEAISANGAKERREIEVVLTGKGKRTVRLAYVVETPVWKSSYRLTLPAGNVEKVHLQGWAILENMSGQDWENVDLVLASGAPVTFRQALYQSYYAHRQMVPVDLPRSAMPKTDSGIQPSAISGGRVRAAGVAMSLAAAPMAHAASMAPESFDSEDDDDTAELAGFESFLTEQAATQVEFKAPHPVSVKAGQSVLIPLIDTELAAKRVSLYQPRVLEEHPFAAISLMNDSGTSLHAGSAAIFEKRSDGNVSFVGDARIPALPAGETRLIPFAQDLRTKAEEKTTTSTVERVAFADGVLNVVVETVSTTRIAFRTPDGESRLLVAEVSRQGSDAVLVSPADAAAIKDGWRVESESAPDGVTVIQLEQRVARTSSAMAYNAHQLSKILDKAISVKSIGTMPDKEQEDIRRIAKLAAEASKASEDLHRTELSLARAYKDRDRELETLNKSGKLEGTDYIRSITDRLTAIQKKIDAHEKEQEDLKAAKEKADEAFGKAISG